WRGEAERVRRTGGQAWKVREAGWRMRLLLRERQAQPAAVRVLLAEHSAAPAGGRWLHESVYWVRHEAHADLNVTWPSPDAPGGRAVQLVSASVDGVEATPLQGE